MKKWTDMQRNARYETYSSQTLATLQAQQANSLWHLHYHLQPKSGLMNDPNGFVYANNRWHLAYQNFPYGAVHGLKSWHEISSDDLQHWQDDGVGLQPHAPYSTQGVYSGSAIAVGERCFLMYTGNVFTESGDRISTQLGAWVDADGTIDELATPLISAPPTGYTQHFRDPQILHQNGRYYAILGAQRQDLRGTILIYSAKQPEGPWQFEGPLDFGYESLGYMIECPNLAFVDGKVALIFCPQGLEQSLLEYGNIHPNVYLLADAVDWDHHKLIRPGKLHNLDFGFDGYAAQVANAGTQGARLISWLGLPDTTYPSDGEDWQGCLSLVRELHLQAGHLRQTPVVDALVGAVNSETHDKIDVASVLHFEWPADVEETLYLGNSQEGLELHLSPQALTIKRIETSGVTATRHATLLPEAHQADLYLDASCFELYLDEGTVVLSGRIFPSGDWYLSRPTQNQVQVTSRAMATIF
ncbi:sucrose-6-phosphate hydrolase [Lacticaseibacillus porcinae]|uniref:sucrose-6-phosphate hydrolase n=1 Tax=Lacticaseibacillus porcinae TaxID=1123687 RepID=UPI000F7B3CF6|nr:sucrose-6-phosphate hydrolase [Lacticaseibacillus porcinae]